MSLKSIYIINLVIGLLVGLAHMPFIALKLSGVASFESVSLLLLSPVFLLDLTLLFGATKALTGDDELKVKALPLQAVIIALLAALLVGMLLWFFLSTCLKAI